MPENETTVKAPMGALTLHFHTDADLASQGVAILYIDTPADCPVSIATNATIGQIATLREACDALLERYAMAQIETASEGGRIQ